MILSGQPTEVSNIQILSDIPFNESELFGKALFNNMDIITSERTLQSSDETSKKNKKQANKSTYYKNDEEILKALMSDD